MATVEIWGRIVFVSSDGVERETRTLGGHGQPDLALVAVLARWQLLARREGGWIRLRGASENLADLLDLLGLLREVGGEPEHGEKVRGIEKGVDPGDQRA
jgi:hypothetical protein